MYGSIFWTQDLILKLSKLLFISGDHFIKFHLVPIIQQTFLVLVQQQEMGSASLLIKGSSTSSTVHPQGKHQHSRLWMSLPVWIESCKPLQRRTVANQFLELRCFCIGLGNMTKFSYTSIAHFVSLYTTTICIVIEHIVAR